MLLTITSRSDQARDLGFLLHKHPDEFQTFDLSFGKCHVFYPQADDTICTVALLLEIDPVKLVRGGSKGKNDAPLSQYVNDRPYVASSLMSVALGKVFRTALNGQCKERPELAERELDLTVEISAAPVKGGTFFLEQVFEPLGYRIEAERLALDEKFPDWGESKLYRIILKRKATLKSVLNHLYVLIPVLDSEKHYYVGEEEIDKLVRRGEDWLGDHPQKETIARRYLFNRRSLAAQALERLLGEEGESIETEDKKEPELEEKLEEKISLNEIRMKTVVASLKDRGARRVIDLGCGEGKLLRHLIDDYAFSEIAGTDVSIRVLDMAKKRLKLSRIPEKKADRLKLFQGSLMYRDSRIAGYDAATCVEVIEHLDEPRLQAFEKVVFKYAKPPVVIITTPNSEYNVLFENMPTGQLRHKDHRFEWTREQFRQWCDKICANYGYKVEHQPIGDEDKEHGAPTQMGVFSSGN